MIKPPSKHRNRRIIRDAAETVIELVPLAGSAITKVLRYTNPSLDDKDLERWQVDVTHGYNKHEQRLDGNDQRLDRIETIQACIKSNSVVGGFRNGALGAWIKSGISSVSDTGIGRYGVIFVKDFPSDNYHVSLTTNRGRAHVTHRMPGSFLLSLFDDNGEPTDDIDVTFAIE